MFNFFSKQKILEDYIKKCLSENFPKEQIRDKLRTVGWSEKLIEKAFKKIGEQISVAEKERKIESWEKGKTYFIEKEKEIKEITVRDLLFLALRIFKTRTRRTILTIMGIGVSFGVILFLVSLGYGFQNILVRQIATEESLYTLDVTSLQPEILPLNQSALNNFTAIEGVKEISPVMETFGQLNFGEFNTEVIFRGVEPSYFKLAGLKPETKEVFKDNKSLFAASVMAETLNLKENEILGKEVKLTFFVPEVIEGTEQTKVIKPETTFKIAGVFEEEFSNLVYLPLVNLNQFSDSFASAKVLVSGSEYLNPVRQKILDMGFNVSALSDTVEQANKIFRAIQIVLALFGFGALIVAVIGMINTMTITLLERINEIGIMKVIGASNKDVKKLFLTESVIIGTLGGVSGLIVGFLGAKLFNFGINILAQTLGGQPINLFAFPLWFLITIIVFSSAVGFLTGFTPARRAAKMDPLQALRYK